MLSTDLAGSQELLAESCTRTVDSNACIGSGDAVLLGEVLHSLLSEINGAKRLGVLRLQATEDAIKASADLVPEIRRRLGKSLQLMRPCRKRSFPGGMAPVAVNHRIPEQAVKPGDGRFIGLKVIPVLKGAKVGSLENVFCQSGVGNPPLHKRKELFALREKLIEWRFRHGSLGRRVEPPTLIDVNGLAPTLAGAVDALTVGATGTVVAFHDVLLRTYMDVCSGKRTT